MQVGGTCKQGMEGYEDLVRSHLFSPFSTGKEQGLRASFEVKALVGLEQDLENPFPQKGAKTFLREIIKSCLSETVHKFCWSYSGKGKGVRVLLTPSNIRVSPLSPSRADFSFNENFPFKKRKSNN